ncbi:hypothetical protein JAAARDRAFT_555570 [Jaapia argillacea MUCL 33604]|uniref:NAD-dependent epimerase/dehydratase domain-containing protein n=1 Tax=Jaapia argillacea MUCL 33604 TaxID=933084 RepID=A0A067QAT2_9AGAM|nr:hypothetical protein JAAARDRAFT_555570 [Jaapia argillacea MUCL 33604]
MSNSSAKPAAIIFGGVNTCSRELAALLVPTEGEPLVSHLRIVDKFSVAPPTTYLGSEFPKILGQSIVEYRQANLTIAATVTSVFDPPEGQPPYSYVFDLTGEVRHDRPEKVHINHTFQVARLIGLEAARRNVKAYVRLQQPFYTIPEKGTHDEKEDIKPLGAVGIWWHETLRALAAIQDLNLVILRIGLVYGPYVDYGYITTIMSAAAVYGYTKKPMKALHSPGKYSFNTVHVADVAGGLLASAEWMSSLGRKEADVLAGEEICFHNSKGMAKEVEGMPPHDRKLIAPLFNLVDDTDNKFIDGLRMLTGYFGTTFKMEDIMEEINEEHVTGWTEMLQASKPPIQSTPITPYIDQTALDKHIIAFSNTKIKEVIGYKIKRPQFGPETIGDIVEKWKAEGTWPNALGK